jgi:SAM-dependent methyltransferase
MNIASSIEFDAPADYYKFRTPYIPKLFEALSEKLAFNENTQILDLDCGSGQIAGGLSPFIGNAIGIDFSEQMLARAEKHANIRYIRNDINHDPVVLPDLMDHFFIGRAIHWIDASALRKTIDNCLRPGGSILIMGSGWSSETAWLAPFLTMRQKYAPNRNLDHRGQSKLKEVGFELIERVQIKARTTCSVDYLVKNSLSYNFSFDKIIANLEEFKQTIAALVAPHQGPDGLLNATIVSWAMIYRKI